MQNGNGKVYSLRGQTKGYKTLVDGCGYGTATGLCGVNCRHTFFPYYRGSKKVYSNKELTKLKNEKVKYNGEMYTEYQVSQIQRKFERSIRNSKKDIAGLEGAMTSTTNEELLEKLSNELIDSKSQLAQDRAMYKEFLEQTKQQIDYTRLKI